MDKRVGMLQFQGSTLSDWYLGWVPPSSMGQKAVYLDPKPYVLKATEW